MTSPTVLSLMLFHFIFLFILSYAENTSFLQLSLFKICFNFFFSIYNKISIHLNLPIPCVGYLLIVFFFLLLLIQKEIKVTALKENKIKAIYILKFHKINSPYFNRDFLIKP